MTNTESNKLLIYFKIFCCIFGKTIIATMILKLIYNLFNISFPMDSKGILMFATFYGLLSIRDYVECSKEIMYNNLSKEDIIGQIQEIMQNENWDAEKISEEQMIFKVPLFKTFRREYLVVNIYENSLEIVGSKRFVKGLIKENRRVMRRK